MSHRLGKFYAYLTRKVYPAGTTGEKSADRADRDDITEEPQQLEMVGRCAPLAAAAQLASIDTLVTTSIMAWHPGYSPGGAAFCPFLGATSGPPELQASHVLASTFGPDAIRSNR